MRRIVVSAESLKQMKDDAKNSKEKPKPVPRSEVFAQLQAGYCGVRHSTIPCAYLQAEHEGLLYPRCLVDAVRGLICLRSCPWDLTLQDLISVQIGTSNDGIASRVEHHQVHHYRDQKG